LQNATFSSDSASSSASKRATLFCASKSSSKRGRDPPLDAGISLHLRRRPWPFVFPTSPLHSQPRRRLSSPAAVHFVYLIWPESPGIVLSLEGASISYCSIHKSTCSTTTKTYAKTYTYRGPTGVPRRTKRARGSAPRHPGRGHVEMRDTPEPIGSGPRDVIHALAHVVPRSKQICEFGVRVGARAATWSRSLFLTISGYARNGALIHICIGRGLANQGFPRVRK
jgi:hypothetical protein